MSQHNRPQRDPLVAPGGIDHHAADMTATFAADITLAEAQRALARANQWLPIDGLSSQPMGALVEANSTGPLRVGFGAWRDLLLGCQFSNGFGELITAGGRTMKNVAGYDLTKLMVGQHRFFGAVVTLTTRTYLRPERALLAEFAPDPGIARNLLISSLRPQWMALTSDALYCGYLGDARVIQFYQSEVRSHGPRDVVWRELRDDISHREGLWRVAPAESSFRASVAPARVLHFVQAAHLRDWVADPIFGVVIGPVEASRRSVTATAARGAGGSVTFFDARGAALNLSCEPATVALLQRLKRQFDPHNTFRPLPVNPV
jgi:hypothetical protein